jgi:hypothetical protein
MYYGVVQFWFVLFGVLEASYVCTGIDFSRFGKLSVIILLNILCFLFACTYSPSSMVINLRFGLLMESVSSCIFFSQVLSCLTNSSLVFPFQAHWGRWHYTRFLRPACLCTVHVGSGPSPLSCGGFLTLPILQAFPLLFARRVLLLLPSTDGLFIYNSMRDCPSLPLWHSGCPALLAICLFLLLLLIIQFFFLFSLDGGVGLSRGLCWSGPVLSVGVPHAT